MTCNNYKYTVTVSKFSHLQVLRMRQLLDLTSLSSLQDSHFIDGAQALVACLFKLRTG